MMIIDIKKHSKKIISIILCICLLSSTISITTLSADSVTAASIVACIASAGICACIITKNKRIKY